MAAVVPELPEPYEFLDLENGHTIKLTITRYESGSATIHPTKTTPRHIRQYMTQQGLTEPPSAGTPISVQIPVLRVWGERIDEASRAPYWDISSKRLMSDLLPRLVALGGRSLTVTITAIGYKPTKLYSVAQG